MVSYMVLIIDWAVTCWNLLQQIMTEDTRKRQKIHPQPDGFLPSKKLPQHLHAPRFQSAFDSLAPKEPATKPPSFPPRPPPVQQNKPVHVQETPNRPNRWKTPIFLARQELEPSKQTIPMKRHEPPTVPIVSRPTTAAKPLSRSSYFLKEAETPPFIPGKPLQRRALPFLESPSPNNAKEMKPLSTTHFASLTDASFDEEDDSVDLSAFLFRLQEHEAGIRSSEHNPDILDSPQKNKHVRFVVSVTS